MGGDGSDDSDDDDDEVLQLSNVWFAVTSVVLIGLCVMMVR